MLVTAFNGTQAVFEAVSPSLSRLSPLSFTDREVSRTCPQLVEVHGRGQPRNVIVLAVNIGVPLAHLGWDGPNAHLDEGLNVYHPCFLFTLVEVSPPMAWASSRRRRCWQCLLGSRAPSHPPTHPGLWSSQSLLFQQRLVEVGLRWGGLRCPCAPSLSPWCPILSVLLGASPHSGVACPPKVTRGCEEWAQDTETTAPSVELLLYRVTHITGKVLKAEHSLCMCRSCF